MRISGTREWAVATINCCYGCPHNCRYCYARFDAVSRQKILSKEEWTETAINWSQVELKQPLYPGQVMFPSRHDIVPENLSACLTVLENLLTVGNRVLIVSKPHFKCIETICWRFQSYQKNILFRFTITSDDDQILGVWEPGAPPYEERKHCLRYAFNKGFSTSVSVEPMLDSSHVEQMIADLEPFVTHSIWLGKMNKTNQRVVCDSDEMKAELTRIEKEQSDQRIKQIYSHLKNNPLVRWKESIKEVVGIESAEQPGLDI